MEIREKTSRVSRYHSSYLTLWYEAKLEKLLKEMIFEVFPPIVTMLARIVIQRSRTRETNDFQNLCSNCFTDVRKEYWRGWRFFLDPRENFACFPLSFLSFNFMIQRTKRTKLEKLMIFEIFPTIVLPVLTELILVTIARSNRDPKKARTRN